MTAITHSFRSFAHQHDDIPAFHAAYLVATFLTAALLNLGYFAVLIAIHMFLDFVKYRDIHRYGLSKTFKAMILESIGDIALFLIALTFVTYLNHTYMLAAVSGLLRSELTLLRAIGTLLPKVRILEHILCIAMNFHLYLHSVPSGLEEPMTRLQKWSIRVVVLCIGLLVLAGFLFQNHGWDLMRILQQELSLAL